MAFQGFQYSDLAQSGSPLASLNATVNSAFETLVKHHDWKEEVQESLCMMCNNSQDVASLQQHTAARNNPNKVRIETVASSASTTPEVAAILKRGWSFLSDWFADPV